MPSLENSVSLSTLSLYLSMAASSQPPLRPNSGPSLQALRRHFCFQPSQNIIREEKQNLTNSILFFFPPRIVTSGRAILSWFSGKSRWGEKYLAP